MKAYMIIDGQWGSCGKGLLAGYLAENWEPDGVVCNFGPNAGHTFINAQGHKFINRQLPNGIVSNSVKKIFIGPGSIIDINVLIHEINGNIAFLKNKEIFIHERAAVVTQKHKNIESGQLKPISSTCKGTGAALVDKIMRTECNIVGQFALCCNRSANVKIVNQDAYQENLQSCSFIQIESAQGFELSINRGSHYPYCTSRDATPESILNECAISYKDLKRTVAVMRTFPIRVGDQYDESGIKIGTSGPVFPDQEEISWDKLDVAVEKTTVTGKVRRVFTWSNINLNHVLYNIRPDFIFLNFVNYLCKDHAHGHEYKQCPKVIEFISNIDKRALAFGYTYPIVRWIGTGPKESDVIEILPDDDMCIEGEGGGYD